MFTSQGVNCFVPIGVNGLPEPAIFNKQPTKQFRFFVCYSLEREQGSQIQT